MRAFCICGYCVDTPMVSNQVKMPSLEVYFTASRQLALQYARVGRNNASRATYRQRVLDVVTVKVDIEIVIDPVLVCADFEASTEHIGH